MRRYTVGVAVLAVNQAINYLGWFDSITAHQLSQNQTIMLYSITRIAKEPKETESSITDLFFKDLDKARDTILLDGANGPYGLCECFYNYIVIEQIQLQDEPEDADPFWQEWYEYMADETWIRIDPPEWVGKTVSFFGAS